MKTKESKKINVKNSNKMKKQISIITVFLWIFLVVIMTTIILKNIKNTNALESNSVTVTYMNGDEVWKSETYLKGSIVTVKNCDIIKVGYKFIGWNTNKDAKFEDWQAGDTFIINADTIFYAIWESKLPQVPKKQELPSIIKEEFVKVNCGNDIHNDRLYSTLSNNLEEIEELSIGEVYYSEEKSRILCDVTLNGKEYAKRYSSDTENHYLVKDENLDEIAVDDKDTQKTITLYYDEENSEWKVLEEIELPITFNVKCYIDVELEGYYNVKHEYYLKDKNNNLILEGTYDLGAVKVVFEKDEVIKVGIASEGEIVDIEVEKIPKYGGIEYEYLENSGNIVIEENVEKEITLKYIREIQEENELKIKVEKIWEDNNNEANKRPSSIILQIFDGEKFITEAEVNEESKWKHTFINLSKYREDGSKIEYTVNEKSFATDKFYTKEIVGNTIINRFSVPEEKVLIKAVKKWEDNNNEYGKRPESVVLQVYNKDRVVTEEKVFADNNWSYEFKLPKYDEYGDEIEYTVDEKGTSKYYEKKLEGYTVINKFVYEPVVDTSDINVFIYIVIFCVSVVAIIVGINIVKNRKLHNK